jgi:hypothetical protein
MKLPLGEKSTLRTYRSLCAEVFGEDSPQVKFLDEKAKTSHCGLDEPVFVPESQMLALFAEMIGGEWPRRYH